jgi:hypothetical protein
LSTETALPTAEEQSAEAGEQQQNEAAGQLAEGEETNAEGAEEGSEAAAGEEKPEGEPAKKELTPEEREIRRLRRRVDNLTKRIYQGQAQPQTANVPLQQPQSGGITRTESPSDDEPIQLTRAELHKLIDQEAAKRAPTIKQQQDEREHRRGIVDKLAKDLGKEKFDALASDLDDAFDGLAEPSGKPKPAVDAIFEAEDPKALIEYLADPEHSDEAEAIGKMPAVKAIRAIARLEDKLAAKAKERPERSNAPAPIEKVRGGGVKSGAPDFRDTKAWVKWRNEQEAKGLD